MPEICSTFVYGALLAIRRYSGIIPIVLYSRSEIHAIINCQPEDLRPLLLSLAWLLSRGQTNLIQDNRFGLLQIDLVLAQAHGFNRPPNDLLDPEVNVAVGANLLLQCGLIPFLGRTYAALIPTILQLAEIIDNASKPIVAPNPFQSIVT